MLSDLGSLPRSGTFLRSPNESVVWSGLAFEFCVRCALIRTRRAGVAATDYSRVDRRTAHRLPPYTAEVISSMGGAVAQSLAIEVGANDGVFLDELARAGWRRRLGIEPSIACAEVCAARGHTVVRAHLDLAQAVRIRERHGPAARIFCRHTLEHVANPLDLLAAMRILLLPGGLLFLEVPDAAEMIDLVKGHELWDEHLHYFSAHNLRLLVGAAGFAVERLETRSFRGAKNLLLWCISGETVTPAADCANPEAVRQCRAFAPRWRALCAAIRRQSQYASHPVLALGASHHQSSYLLFTGMGDGIDFLVDDDPGKANRYVPLPKPVKVITTPDALALECPGSVLRTAFGYDDWMDEFCHAMEAKGAQLLHAYPKTEAALQ